MVEVKDVREMLNNLSVQRVPDETVEKRIQLANTIVENEKSGSVTDETLEDARLVIASYLTLDAYADRIERSAGRIPPAMQSQLIRWEERKKIFLSYIKRGSISLLPLVEQPDTLREQWRDGDLNGEYY